MSKPITLLDSNSETIRRNVVARFKKGHLHIDGQDLGEIVEAYWGDSDYEYMLTVIPENVPKLHAALDLTSPSETEVLEILKARFAGEKCFENLRDFLKEKEIPFDFFNWA